MRTGARTTLQRRATLGSVWGGVARELRLVGPLGRWSYLRALLITLALTSQCVSALPARPLTAERLARPEWQRALSSLSAWSQWFGAAADRQVWESRLIAYNARALRLRQAALSPLSPLLDAAAIRQQWTLFLSAHAQVFRLRVDVRSPGRGWTLAYRAHQEDTLGLASLLGYRRLRGIYHPTRQQVRPQYAALTAWLAARIMREHREISRVRVGLERIQIAAPGVAPQVQGLVDVLEHGR